MRCVGRGRTTTASIEQRREAMGVGDGLVTSVDLEPFAGAAESLVGVAVIPVSAVPIEIELGAYELDERRRRRRDGPRGRDGARAARAHRGRPHRLDDPRRARGRGDPHLRARTTASRARRASSARDAGEAIALARWVEAELPAMRAWLEASDDPSLSTRARSCAASRRTSSARCATCCGGGRPATPSGRT